jgi:hypothetical protein
LLHNPPTIPAQALQREIENASQTWEATDQFRQLESVLSSLTVPDDLAKITAFALGSLTQSSEPCPPTILQHALVLALRRLLFPGDRVVKCYAQDPAYTDPDKQALAALGVTVLDDPRGFIEVDEQSVVLSIAPNVPVKQIVIDISRPAVIIWLPSDIPFPDRMLW